MVIFETKCYENDWEILLRTNRLEQMIENCNYNFNKRILYLNNITNMNEAVVASEFAIKKGIIDEYYIVENYAAAALQFFNLDVNSFVGGYYYSIAELVGIYLCQTPYLLHFSSDSIMAKTSVPWVAQSIVEMEKNSNIIVANPVWNFQIKEARNESIKENSHWYLGQGFSDQCYLIKTEEFKKQIYNETNPYSERYPKYGGELFEKRVDAYMRNHKKYRITHKGCSYLHQNFPKKENK